MWFFAMVVLAELLVVGVNSTNKTVLLPNSPTHWSSVCVLGPLPGIVVCVMGAVVAQMVVIGCYHAVCRLTGKDPASFLSSYSQENTEKYRRSSLGGFFVSHLAGLGSSWRPMPTLIFIEGTVMHVATIALSTGLSGLVYYGLGGHFLLDVPADLDMMQHFVLPFVGLTVMYAIGEHGTYIILMNAVDPVDGTKGVYAIMLRSKLALIEDVLPVVRGEAFLVVVVMMLCYLYIRIGAWGLAVAITPILALRDFFRKWVDEKEAYLGTITTLATYMQHYHPYTRGHLKRVADMSERLAREIKLPAESIRHISSAGFLHDIGKIAVSEEILDKTGSLDDEEWAKIREHPVKGAEIVSHIEFLEGIVDWIKYHHKWHDGRGYPDTNGNGNVPIEAAIIAVADSFDAMTDDREISLVWKCDACGYRPSNGDRPVECPMCGAAKRRTYRPPKTTDEAIEELRRGAGSQFNPIVVKAFLAMVKRDGISVNV